MAFQSDFCTLEAHFKTINLPSFIDVVAIFVIEVVSRMVVLEISDG